VKAGDVGGHPAIVNFQTGETDNSVKSVSSVLVKGAMINKARRG
jgi:hypothetical protein